jgi:hypothetical protein
MPLSRIDFSAEFGGRDAAAALMPHFKALKAAARGLSLPGFPVAVLAFILRVDGEVHRYGLSGLGNSEIDKDGEYVSFDIGIEHDDRNQIPEIVTAAILSSVEQIKTLDGPGSWEVDCRGLQQCLSELCVRYKHELTNLFAG